MSDLKMKTFDVHNNSPIVSRDAYSGSYRGFQMSYECMVEIRQLENILKSEVMLVDSISRREKKLAKQLEIQTKRVENLKKGNEFYSEKDNWEQPIIRGYQALRAEKILDRDCGKTEDDIFTGGKLARSCQAIDQELEKKLENLK